MALPLPMPPPARQTTRVRTPLFLVGVGLALVAFIAMFAFGILFASRSSDGAKVPVVVAIDDNRTVRSYSCCEVTSTSYASHSLGVVQWSQWKPLLLSRRKLVSIMLRRLCRTERGILLLVYST